MAGNNRQHINVKIFHPQIVFYCTVPYWYRYQSTAHWDVANAFGIKVENDIDWSQIVNYKEVKTEIV